MDHEITASSEDAARVRQMLISLGRPELDDIIAELKATKTSERAGRAQA